MCFPVFMMSALKFSTKTNDPCFSPCAEQFGSSSKS